MRMTGHAQHDDMRYVPPGLLDAWRDRDPLDRFEAFLLQERIATRSDLDAVVGAIDGELEEAERQALDSPPPDAGEALRGVYREPGYETPWWPSP